nr:TonB-dependent receptor [Pseudomonas typographi]
MHSNNTQYELGDGQLITTGNVLDSDTLDFPHIPRARDKSYDSRNIQRGLILQDQITVLEKLHLLFAGKESVWESQTNIVGGASTPYRETKWVPNYGIAYDLTPEITAYANVLHGFSGSANIDRSGNALPPSSSTAKEVGLKFSLLDDRFTLTTALFDIKQTNVPLEDQMGQYIGAEGRHSKGFDLDLNGQIVPGWNLTASYTYSKFEDPGEVNGEVNKVTGQPKHSANVWTTYELQDGPLKGFGAGIGVTAASDMLSGYRTSTYFNVAGYAQTDMSVFYHQKNWSLNLGVKNLFDRDIYSYSTSVYYLGVKDGRTTRLTAEYRF